LRGVEEGSLRSQSWQISGRVIDCKTGKPITSFQVTPGTSNIFPINLALLRMVEGGNGVYAIAFNNHGSSRPHLGTEHRQRRTRDAASSI
jgi:hypothetical protein